MGPPARSAATSSAARDRDAALARAGRVRGLTIAGSAALSAALAGLVAASPPSQANPSATGAGVPRATPSAHPVVLHAPQLPPLASASALGLRAPSQTPQSGGSSAGNTGAGTTGSGSTGSGNTGAGNTGSGASSAAQSDPQEPTPAPSQTVTPAAPAVQAAPSPGVVSGGS